MDINEKLREFELQLAELNEHLKLLTEKQNTQYTDIMLLLKSIETKLKESEVEVRSDDELCEDAKELVISEQVASISFLQRTLQIGYARAARLMDRLESEGIIGPEGDHPRKVLVKEEEGA